MNKIYRSRTDKKLFGLCGGLAEAMNVDATLTAVSRSCYHIFLRRNRPCCLRHCELCDSERAAA